MNKLRHWLRKFHFYLACASALPLLVVCITGSILVYQDPLDVAVNPGLLKSASAQSERMDLDGFHKLAQGQFPDVRFWALNIPGGKDRSLELWSGHGDDFTSYHFDPSTARFLGMRRSGEWTFANVVPLILDVHYSLKAGERGRYIVGTSALVLTFSALTGLLLWMPRHTKNLLNKFALKKAKRWKQTAYIWHSNLGFYFSPIILALSMTGVSFTFHEISQALLEWMTQSPPSVEVPKLFHDKEKPQLSIEELFSRSETYLKNKYGYAPGRMQINFATEDNGAIRTRFQGLTYLFNADRFNVWLDPHTGEILQDISPPTLNTADSIMSWTGPLHFGTWGDIVGPKLGSFSRLVWAIGALMPLFFAITGLWFWKKSKVVKRIEQYRDRLSRKLNS
ncbi:MAG: PepSY domain-containing protein [Pseudobdellovibrionaceae bacterium]|nr:PepSY domain-containing protein [Pseudobdellovibrionaceae bacterium]